MAVDNPVQFAIVREDPEVELGVLARLAQPRSALLVASGGCTAFTVAARRPEIELTLIDMNRAQLDLVERKRSALRRHPPGSEERARLFGVGRDDPQAFTCCGNFESLFRGLRAVWRDLVAADARELIRAGAPPPNKYWPVSFQMFFGDALLEAMFGPDATQHAPRGSYPSYFQRVIEQGLARDDRDRNPWLHHVLLGHYLEEAQPDYLLAPCAATFEMVHANMADAPRFDRFDLVSLSNLFDWMNTDVVQTIARRLCEECRPGTAVIVRQLNNRAPIERLLLPAFALDEDLSRLLHARDRSMFYERLLVFVRRG